MSKPNEKNATAQASSAADGASDLALVQPTPAASTAPAQGDENHGRGGMYVVVDGVRKRIAGTEPAAVVTASKELQ